MKRSPIVVVSFLATACSSSTGGGSPSLDGTWFYADSAGTAGFGATFTSEGTYVVQDLVLTSTTSGDDQIETGTFTTSGNTITLTPEKWSCPGPDAVYQLTYSFDGGDLVIAQPSGIVSLQPDTAAASSFALTLGCFDSSGNFTASPLAPVSN